MKKYFTNLKLKTNTKANKVKNSFIIVKLIDFYKKNTLIVDILLVIFYKLILDAIYAFAIAPSYLYSGFISNFSFIKYTTAFLSVLMFSYPIVGLYKQKLNSALMLFLINLIYFIPITTLYAFSVVDTSFFILVIVYWVILMICQYKFPVLVLKKNEKTNKNLDKIYVIMLLIISLVILFIWARHTNFRIQFDFINVYDIRAESKTYQLPKIVKYFLSMSGIIVPFFIVYALENKKLLLTLYLILLWLINFSIGGHKTVFYIGVVVVIGYFFYKEAYIKLIIPLLIAFAAIAFLIFKVFNQVFFIGAFFRRVMFVPSLLSYNYYQFMQENRLNLFTSSILNKLGFENNYSTTSSVYVANFIGTTATTNNGLLGDGLVNLGYISIIIMPIIIVLIFRLLDMCSSKLKPNITVAICVYFAVSFTNASWSTMLLSNGFLAICVCLALYPEKTKEKNYEIL